ncbi:CcmD family protein [Mucilaginibacter phyllosphaerae]|uniref:CcmD family protein n=1 Tax=Mucilaginibacter phyllosphaerae TaxID=1812349 RepID=A0A4Y8AJG9_9SPHI|nr:CcmD family protein [Mucilaginibacter phyllosphaerae]MBB3968352.1 CcmD family protein [Mucilaginibacter phyllosphaerae]TEW68649.1 CcmD family protein [Mucilaginibacter phyllosphaerae]GGG99533.1 hypothetical protein GCM10007352_00410 [Mucilaginibacter phyllosphaerae]
MKKLAFLLPLLFCFAIASAQQAQPVEMADVLRSSGKIYVVIATICIIFAGLAVYLFSIDRRLKKLEKEN